MRWYARVPDWIDRPLLAGVARLRAMRPRREPVRRFTGLGLTVERAGRSTAVDYFLDNLVGADRRVALADATPDVSVTRGDARGLARRFGDTGWLVPEAIGAVVRLDDPADPTPWINATSGRNLRRVRKHGLTWSMSHDVADFDFFYRRMYKPYAAARFADQQSLRSEHRLLRRFRAGGLLWVSQGDRRLAASLISMHGKVARSWVFAPYPDHADAVKLGALAATYVYTFEWARSQGCRAVDLGASRASLTDGVLLHKKSWGAAIAPEPGVGHAIHFRWPRMTPAIARFLHATPLVVRDGDGFAGLTALPMDAPLTTEQVEEHLHRTTMPGLTRLHVIAASGLRLDCADIKGIPLRWMDAE